MPTLQELRTPLTREQALSTISTFLGAVGYTVTSWFSGGANRTLIEMAADIYASLTEMIAEIAEGQFNDLAKGDYLERLADSHYDNQKTAALTTRGNLRLTCASGSGPYSPAVGSVVASNGLRTYRLIDSGVVIPSGSSVTALFEAEIAGADGNVADGTITTLVTTLAGVTVTNDPGWITRLGQDAESVEALRTRNRTKWATLAVETIYDGVVAIATKAAPAVRKVAVDDNNPRGPFTFDVYVAGETGTATPSDVSAVQSALEARFFGDAASLIDTVAATTLALNVTGTIYYSSGYTASEIEAAVEDALLELIRLAPLGGYDLSPGPSHVIPRNDIIAAIEDIDGVRLCDLSTPSGNVSVSAFQLVVPGTYTLTFTPVAA